MVSRTKADITAAEVTDLLKKSGFAVSGEPEPMTEGEFNVIFSAKTDKGEVVIKLSPTDEGALLTHEKGIMERELKFYEIIAEKTQVPVPKILYSDFSRSSTNCDFFVMEKIGGKTLDKCGFTAQQKRTAITDIITRLHSVKGEGFGYSGEFKTWYEALRSMTADLYSDGEKILKSGAPCRPLLKSELKKIKRLLGHIDRNREALEKVESRLVNFDLWDKNMIYDGERIYMIDPERSFFGDFVGDLAGVDMMKLSLSDKKDFIALYNEKSGRNFVPGREEEIRFLLLLGYLCSIMAVEKFYRYTPSNPGFIRNTFMDFQFARILKALEKREKH